MPLRFKSLCSGSGGNAALLWTKAGGAQPQAVVLGHLSEDCNRPHLPALEIAAYFNRKKLAVKFEVHLAARHEAGPVIVIK